MQEHVKLEIALEVLINEIASVIHQINSTINLKEKTTLETYLEELLEMKEKAYQGDRKVIEKILSLKRNENHE